MTNKNIFNAIRSIDEELILGASTSEKAPGAKRKILLKALTSAAAVILVISLSIGGAMMFGREDIEVPSDVGEEKVPIDFNASHGLPTEYFANLDDLREYINDKENQTVKMDDIFVIDFNSIISDSEIVKISATYTNRYSVKYVNKDENIPYSIAIDVMKYEKHKINLDKMKENGVTNKIPCKSVDELMKLKTSTSLCNIHAKFKEYDVLYYRGVNRDNFMSIIILVNGYRIDLHWFEEYNEDDYTTAQYEFLRAIVPEYGATDESIIEMLDKIKVLIPTGDEANGVQVNANASVDASFELGSTNPTDIPSSDDSGNSEQTAGETVADTDVTNTPVNEEEEEYLYPEDYEFPVIPGISPDWKPNRNGKYPLKDGYTREEMTLIVACAIELDFGDMTDEEISKIDFIIIDDEEETEDNTEQ
ncbi:MAG: hypothetical protein IKM18_03675 [Clostridia bacterium]|nr:hypothetical protein [Clostridia bacterium]